MRPVPQEIISDKDGDCLRACVASLLHLSLKDVPNFVLSGQAWKYDMRDFLAWHGFTYNGEEGKPEEVLKLSKGVDGYYIAIVPSIFFKHHTHAVIFKGKRCVFDPSPRNNKKWKIGDVLEFFIIDKTRPLPFRVKFRQCIKSEMVDKIFTNHPTIDAMYWCKHYDCQCKSSVCREYRGIKPINPKTPADE